MQRRENLGEVFHSFRTNRNISLKQIADANISVSQISRFERGDSDITLGKFLRLLENMHVEMNEFMDAVHGNDKSETIQFMRQLIPLEYKRDIAGFQRLFREQKEKYEKSPSVYQYRLNMILAQSFICKCDDARPFPKEYMDEVADYLFSVEEWKIYELILIGNLYLFMDIPLLHKMGQEILHTYEKTGANKSLVLITLLNIWETCLHRNALSIAAYYRDSILPLIDDETMLYERNLYLFLSGLHHFLSGEKELGTSQMKQAIQIYEWLDCPHLARNYKDDRMKYAP
ncbi:MAG: helix-turn-helix domain-containing protein [Oscillospiraceae bacterium]|nr:helix-turn-helix domain-containing protein [Oscillospiraceae bacterium]